MDFQWENTSRVRVIFTDDEKKLLNRAILNNVTKVPPVRGANESADGRLFKLAKFLLDPEQYNRLDFSVIGWRTLALLGAVLTDYGTRVSGHEREVVDQMAQDMSITVHIIEQRIEPDFDPDRIVDGINFPDTLDNL